MRILIVENENLAVKRLRKLLSEIHVPTEVAGVTRSITETVAWLNTHPHPNIILLDIELADGQSIEIFNQVQVKSKVVVITSYNEPTLAALQLSYHDYLLKPIAKEDIGKIITKYRDMPDYERAG